MRPAAAVLVAMMILLAGCSGGGGGTASPTETSAPDTTQGGTPTEGTTTTDSQTTTTPPPTEDGDEDGQTNRPSPSQALSSINASEPFKNATAIEMTLFNGSSQTDLLIKNDTDAGEELIRIDRSSGGTTTLYTTNDYAASRNTTTGEIRYGKPDGSVGFSIGFEAAFTLIGGLSYASIVEWQPAGTTSVDGATGYVYEANSLNWTRINNRQNLNLRFTQDDVNSVDSRMVITSDGKIKSITVKIETTRGTFGSDLSVTYSDITISKPGWVDESKAPS